MTIVHHPNRMQPLLSWQLPHDIPQPQQYCSSCPATHRLWRKISWHAASISKSTSC
jgi:hypothetical protein